MSPWLHLANAYLIQYEFKPNQRYNQTMFLLQQIEEFNAPFQLPVVLCGSFYFDPSSPEYCIVTTGCAPVMEVPPGPPGNVEALTPSEIAARIGANPGAQHYVLVNNAWADARSVRGQRRPT